MAKEILKNIKTDKVETEFQMRWESTEKVGLLTTKKGDHYLMLDSLAYWYDVVQRHYPKKKICTCKNDWFTVEFDYLLREENDDVQEIAIYATCTVCQKKARPIRLDIKYGGTDELISKPLTFCKKPNIKYKTTSIHKYWAGNNVINFFEFMMKDLGFYAYCWYSEKEKPNVKMKYEKVSLEQALQIIKEGYTWLQVDFSMIEFDPQINIAGPYEHGVYLKEDIWRRQELIHFAKPILMVGVGYGNYTYFCNQYLDKLKVVDKSKAFEEKTEQVKKWFENDAQNRDRNVLTKADLKEKYPLVPRDENRGFHIEMDGNEYTSGASNAKKSIVFMIKKLFKQLGVI